MFAVFISMISNCNGFKVKITKYQLRKQIGLVLNKSRQYNILGFDLIIGPPTQRVCGISEPGFCKRYGFFFTTSIVVKVKKNNYNLVEYIDFSRNSAYFT